MNSITLDAPAKVNLFLKVLSKRRDSYHTIHTIFERISLHDRVTIMKRARGIIVTSDVRITSRPHDNLAYKAAALLLSTHRIASGVKIEITKRIPLAAGLGGGSSDAAAVLRGMNRLFRLRLTQKELMALGRTLGADVPFFLLNVRCALGRGIGDDLVPLKTRLNFWHLIMYPNFKVAAQDVYEAYDAPDFALTRVSADAKIGLPLGLPRGFEGTEAMLHNDLEQAAIFKKPAIGKILPRLAITLCKKIIVSGSGPSLFCLYRTEKEVTQARGRLLGCVPARERHGWRLIIAKTR